MPYMRLFTRVYGMHVYFGLLCSYVIIIESVDSISRDDTDIMASRGCLIPVR